MSSELNILALTAMLTASLWIPYIVCQVMTNGPLSAENYVDPTPASGSETGANLRAPRLPECGGTFRAVRGAGAGRSGDRQKRLDDGVLGDKLLLDKSGACRHFLGRNSVHPHDPFRARLDLRHRALRRTDEVVRVVIARSKRDEAIHPVFGRRNRVLAEKSQIRVGPACHRDIHRSRAATDAQPNSSPSCCDQSKNQRRRFTIAARPATSRSILSPPTWLRYSRAHSIADRHDLCG